jgi:8-oxo-dGTP pyrophosphatase MutT (NUDIX family)
MRRVTEAGILTAVARRLGRALTARPRPAHRILVDGVAIGFVDATRRARLARFTDVFRDGPEGSLLLAPDLADAAMRSHALGQVARTLADEGALSAWRDERYAVAARFADPPLFTLERAAARYFGIATYAAHANGYAHDDTGPLLWFARRSARKPIDPGQLDNLVGGGIAAGESPDATLVREAFEEAGVPAALACNARRVGALRVARCAADGFQRETIVAYDLPLPAGFVPVAQDGEAVEHRRVDRATALRLIAVEDGPDVVTLDASLVVLDWLARHGVDVTGTPAEALLDALRVEDPDGAPDEGGDTFG